MSFVVSFNGQFKKYQLPDMSSYDRRVHRIVPSDHVESIKESETRSDFAENKKNFQKVQSALKKFKNHENYKDQKSVRQAHVRDLMHSPVHCANEKNTVKELHQMMEKYHTHHLPIINDEERIVGIVSDRDLIMRSERELAKSIMVPEVITAMHTARVVDIAKIMLIERIHCLPIINDKHVLIGIITDTDILEHFVFSDSLSANA
jgi:CBS domain-containing protein